jgi:hypothetical protein
MDILSERRCGDKFRIDHRRRNRGGSESKNGAEAWESPSFRTLHTLN